MVGLGEVRGGEEHFRVHSAIIQVMEKENPLFEKEILPETKSYAGNNNGVVVV